MAANAILDCQAMCIRLFRRIDSVVFVLCTNHWDRRTYDFDFQLMTSRELTSGFAAILYFQIMWIWPFRRVDSVAFVFRTKFGSNVCYSHWDRSTYAEDLYLMTSHELTSCFDFWSRDHLRMAMMHLRITFGANIFIQSSYCHFSKIQDGGRRHLGLSDYVTLAIPACW